jgi:outer membrane murein-binding lipoprotein Lpp
MARFSGDSFAADTPRVRLVTAAHRRRRLLRLSMAASALVLLAGCGGNSANEQAAPAPKLSAALGAQLADKAELVAIRLKAGDEAGAKQLADDLRGAVEEAILAGEIPRALRPELTSTVRDLVASIQVPTGPPAKKTKEDKGKPGRGHDEGEGEGEGHGHED